MFTVCYQYRWMLFGLVLLLAAEPSQAAGMAQRGVEVLVTRALARQGLTITDLDRYHQSSMSAIIKVMATTGLKVKTLREASNMGKKTIPYHLQGRGVMHKSSLTKLQTAMRHAVDSTELDNQQSAVSSRID